MGKVRVAIIGVGNCASSFVQGLHYYRNAKETDRVPGLMHVNLGGYHIRDVEIVGRDRHRQEQGRQGPRPRRSSRGRTTPSCSRRCRSTGVDGAARHDARRPRQVPVADHPEGAGLDGRHRQAAASDTKTDVVVNYLPVGSEEATKWYVEQVLEAGCAFVNCIPVFIAREKYWQQRFEKQGPAGDRRRHQVAGRRHDHAPRAARACSSTAACASTAPTSSTSAATPTS